MRGTFVAVGIDFRDTPLEWRGLAAPKHESFALEISPSHHERVWVSTCNRVELYASGPEDETHRIAERWITSCELPDEMKSRFHVYHGPEAIRHLFRVSSSLESMVVGEAQILGQIKRAYDQSVALGWSGPTMHKVFQAAFRAAKRVRSQTELGKLAVSIPSLGVKVAEKVIGDLSSRRVGILGIGEIGRVTAEHFASVQPAQISLYNRTQETAQRLAKELEGQGASSVLVSDSRSILESCDVIVCAAEREVLPPDALAILEARQSMAFVLDLAVPACLPSVSNESIYVYQVDDLKKMADQNNQLRLQEMSRADQIVTEEVERSVRQLQSLQLDATLAQLATKLDEMTLKELEHLRKNLPQLSEAEFALIREMAKRMAQKFLQEPTVELKALLSAGEEEDSLLRFFRSIFRI